MGTETCDFLFETSLFLIIQSKFSEAQIDIDFNIINGSFRSLETGKAAVETHMNASARLEMFFFISNGGLQDNCEQNKKQKKHKWTSKYGEMETSCVTSTMHQRKTRS
ncbi:hypothetical protein TNCV_2329491 [Trichonephila clavipes]|nr:hypothetical protein TNCV_2329491 [Trichonephila clavipes]